MPLIHPRTGCAVLHTNALSLTHTHNRIWNKDTFDRVPPGLFISAFPDVSNKIENGHVLMHDEQHIHHFNNVCNFHSLIWTSESSYPHFLHFCCSLDCFGGLVLSVVSPPTFTLYRQITSLTIFHKVIGSWVFRFAFNANKSLLVDESV